MTVSAQRARMVACLLALLLGGLATVRVAFDGGGADAVFGVLPPADEDRLRVNDLNFARLSQTQDGRERLEQDARDHLMSEPLSARALRQLGAARALAGDDTASKRLHNLAERLSRRDLGTQLWMIERSAAAGDVAETLRHYDLALTTEPSSGDLLYPVLADAIADEAVREALTPYVRADRPWVHSFLATALDQASPAALAGLIAIARPETVKTIMGRLLGRMARDADFATARTLLMATAVGRAASASMAVSDRTTAPQLGPFGWELARSDGVDAMRDGEGFVVRISSGASGLAARRVLILRPGRYRFGYAVQSRGEAGGASLSTDAQCLSGPNSPPPLPTVVTNADEAGKQVEHALTVPAGCSAVAMVFRVIGSDAQQDETLRVDRIALTANTGG